MSIRQWAQRILSNNKMNEKLDQLKQAHTEIPILSLGGKVNLSWVLPIIKPTEIEPRLTPEIKLLHSITHIELMAIYLYWDTLSMIDAPKEFYLDLSSIAIQECEHFELLCKRLENLGCPFPSYECRDYMSEFSFRTQDDILARLLYVSLYSEGRAIDSKERLVKKLKGYNTDQVSAVLLEKIINDEVSHLKNGVKWFKYFAKELGVEASEAHDQAMRKLGLIYRPPFNKELRDKAGVPEEWYFRK